MSVPISPQDARKRIIANFLSPSDASVASLAAYVRRPLRIRVRLGVMGILRKAPPLYVAIKWLYQHTLKRLGI